MEQVNTTSASLPKDSFNWSDFLSFKLMVTLRIIQIIYMIVAIFITIGALFVMFKGQERGYGSSGMMPGGFLGGLLILVFGNIGWRIWCELMIVVFRINKSLTNIDNNTSTKR